MPETLREIREKDKKFVSEMRGARLYHSTGDYPKIDAPKYTVRRGLPWPKNLSNGNYPYVVMGDGEIRIPQKPTNGGFVHHPELAGDRDVVAAGVIKVQRGIVTYLSNESGHYCPDEDSVYSALKAFHHWEVPLDSERMIDTSWVCR